MGGVKGGSHEYILQREDRNSAQLVGKQQTELPELRIVYRNNAKTENRVQYYIECMEGEILVLLRHLHPCDVPLWDKLL